MSHKLSDGTIIPSSYHFVDLQLSHSTDTIKGMDTHKIGTIIGVRYVDSTTGIQESASQSKKKTTGTPYETVYDVRVDDHNNRSFVFHGCRVLKPFMGVNNYFEVIHESAEDSTTYAKDGLAGLFSMSPESMTGSRCVVACIEGSVKAGIILGFIQHPARPSTIKKAMGLQMEFEFNGFKTTIDKNGALKILANGPFIPSVTLPLVPVVKSVIRANPLVGPFTISLDKDMTFLLKDNTDQMFELNRSKGTITVGNGKESLIFKKPLFGPGETTLVAGKSYTVSATKCIATYDVSYAIATKEFSIKADVSTKIECGKCDITVKAATKISAASMEIKATTTFKVDAGKMAFKGATGELITLLTAILDGIGKIKPISPVGPCGPLMGTPDWAAVLPDITKLKGLMA